MCSRVCLCYEHCHEEISYSRRIVTLARMNHSLLVETILDQQNCGIVEGNIEFGRHVTLHVQPQGDRCDFDREQVCIKCIPSDGYLVCITVHSICQKEAIVLEFVGASESVAGTFHSLDCTDLTTVGWRSFEGDFSRSEGSHFGL